MRDLENAQEIQKYFKTFVHDCSLPSSSLLGAQVSCQESANQNRHSNKSSPGAPTPKRPKVGMNYGKRRARRREGAGDKAPECAIAAGRRVGRQTVFLVSVLAKTGINSIKKRVIYTKLTNICTTSSPADPQMHGSLNVQDPRAQGAFVRDGRWCGIVRRTKLFQQGNLFRVIFLWLIASKLIERAE